MRISTRFSAAIHTLLLLEHHKSEKVTSSFIAMELDGNPVIYRNLLARLKEAGFVCVAPGKGKEGTRLAMPLSKITLWDVFVAVESVDFDSIFKNYDYLGKRNENAKIVNEIIYPHFVSSIMAAKAVFANVTLSEIMEEFLGRLDGESPGDLNLEEMVQDILRPPGSAQEGYRPVSAAYTQKR